MLQKLAIYLHISFFFKLNMIYRKSPSPTLLLLHSVRKKLKTWLNDQTLELATFHLVNQRLNQQATTALHNNFCS